MKNNKQKIIDILKSFEITFWTYGKNVSTDSVNIQCPFCNDHSNHCGIFQDSMLFHCWRCNVKGSFAYLLSEITPFSETECEKLVQDFDVSFKESTLDQIQDILTREEPIIKSSEIEEIRLPQYFEKITQDIDFPLFSAYLKRRKISIDTVIRAKCGIARVGEYNNRMIIPIFSKGIIVAYQAADLTGGAKVKYRTGPKDVFVNNYLYNYDNIQVGGRMLVNEGVLDAWREGETAVCSFGTSLTEKQKNLILEKKLAELIFVYDGDAYWKSRKIAGFFEPFIPIVRTIKIPNGEDPDSFGKDKIDKLIVDSV